MDEIELRVQAIIREAREKHMEATGKTEESDHDWPTWYSEYIVNKTDIADVVGAELNRSELTYMFIHIERDFLKKKTDETWDDFLAKKLSQFLAV